ncbi:LysR substrate-binding domain-containing protein [Colwellia psychrerythraea]|nr:LysR substrate-binding domain-containing protein [Colwellia psychrerythraea]
MRFKMHSQLPPLNSIRVFDAAARLGSFKKAAEELHVTPTAISHQIKTLEEALGTLLFVRKTRVIQLTPEGKLLAETAYNILQQLTNTISEISNTKNIITVSTTSSFAAMWLVPNLSKFNQLYPDIDVAVKTGEQVEDLEKDRRIDLAIRYGTYDNSLKNSILLTTEEIGVYATPYYIKSINLLGSANLLETKWDNKNLTEISWHTLFKDNNNHELVYKTRQFTQEHHIIQAALAGQGIALVSSLLVQNAIEQGWLVKYHFTENRKKIDGFSYYLVIPEHNLRSKSIMAFKNWLVDELM